MFAVDDTTPERMIADSPKEMTKLIFNGIKIQFHLFQKNCDMLFIMMVEFDDEMSCQKLSLQ